MSSSTRRQFLISSIGAGTGLIAAGPAPLYATGWRRPCEPMHVPACQIPVPRSGVVIVCPSGTPPVTVGKSKMSNPGPTGTNDNGTSVYGLLVNLNDETQIIPGGMDLDTSGTAWNFRFMCDAGNYLLRVETFEMPTQSAEKELIIDNSNDWPCNYFAPWDHRWLKKMHFKVKINDVIPGAKTIVRGTTKFQNNHPATERVYGMILRPGHASEPVIVGTTIKHGPDWEIEFNRNINSLRPCAIRVRVRQPDTVGQDDKPYP